MEQKCPKCGSARIGVHDRNYTNTKMRMKCHSCDHKWSEHKPSRIEPGSPKVGMSLTEFREKHDTEFIVDKTLKTLDRKTIYEKADVIKLCKLSTGTMGITGILEAKSNYYGKISGRQYFSHPDTIAELREQGKLN